tara:strand:- start:141 stop:482 length:342 start_codon:yes stop_codon:yes gene_type:complete
MQIKSETKLPNTVITIRLTTAKEMFDFAEITHDHSEYDTDWDELLYRLSEYKGIDSHIYVQYLSSDKQPKNGDVICLIHLYCKDYEKLDYLEAEITKRISTALTVTWPWERNN